MSVVLAIRQHDGQENSIWAAMPSNLFTAIANAQKEAGQRIALGGLLTVVYTGERPNEKNPKLNPIKLYEASYSPPDAFATDNGAVTGAAVQPGATAPVSTPPAAAPAAAAPAAPAAAPAGPPPAAVGEQIKVLIGAGMTDTQIANVPAVANAGVDITGIAAVRAAQGLPANP